MFAPSQEGESSMLNSKWTRGQDESQEEATRIPGSIIVQTLSFHTQHQFPSGTSSQSSSDSISALG
jgi:hypothetical protein